MRYLKSVFLIVLVSIFAVQANANILLPTSLMEESVMVHIIDIIQEGRSLEVSNNVNENIGVTLTCFVNGNVYSNTLSANSILTLSDLAPGSYELTATSTSGDEIVSIIIE